MTAPQITIVYEDNDLFVIEKPAGVTVNNAQTTKGQMTIQDWAEERIGIKNPAEGEARQGRQELGIKKGEEISPEENFYNRGGIVHRLDKETSGLLIIAKNPAALVNLQAQFKERTVKKTYLALAHGKLVPRTGEIDVPVGRLPWNRTHFGIVPGGRESKTLYTVLDYYQVDSRLRGNDKGSGNDKGEILSLVELYPQSGRTHQIRVHLKYLNHPIFADELYGGRKTARNDRKVLSRLFLHAAKLSFTQPTTGVLLSFESALPPDLAEFLKSLNKEISA